MANNSSVLDSSPRQPTDPCCVTLRVLFAVIACLSVIGNCFVIAVVIRNRRLRKQTSSFVILSLAITDMLTGVVLVATPVFIIGEHNVPIPSGLAGELFCRLISSQYFVFTLGKVSIATVTCLAIERWFAVARPVTYKFNFTRRRMTVYLVLIWTICCAMNCRSLFEKRLVRVGGTYGCKWVSLVTELNAVRAYVVIYAAITFLIPFFISMAAFTHLYVIIRRRGCVRNGSSNPVGSRIRPAGPVVQLVRMCFVTTLVLGVCWLPNQVFFVLTKYSITRFDTPLHHVTIVLSMLNSCVNPFVYFLTSRTYRRGFVELVCCCCQDNSVTAFETEMTINAALRVAQERERGNEAAARAET